MGAWQRLVHLDRRWIFLTILVAVVTPFLTGLQFLPGTPSPATSAVHEAVEKLPAEAVLMIAFDYGPAGMPEMQPMAVALLHQAFARKLRVIALTIHPQGPLMAEQAFATVARETGAVYGRDFVNLGFKPGGSAVILGLGTDLNNVYTTDMKGTPLRSLPVMKGVRNYDDVALLVDLATGNAPGAWIAFAHERFKLNLAIGVTAVMATDFYPYFQTGQLVGLINGLRGASEYEHLIGRPDRAALGMSSQSVAHMVIILFVILGNIGYFVTRRRKA